MSATETVVKTNQCLCSYTILTLIGKWDIKIHKETSVYMVT